MSKCIVRVKPHPIRYYSASAKNRVIEKSKEPEIIERYHITTRFQDHDNIRHGKRYDRKTQDSEAKLKIVLEAFDKAERKVFGISRNFSKYKWYLPYRRKAKGPRMKNKYYDTLVRITDWLYNQCTGKTNLLAHVAYDYGCVTATNCQEQFQGKPYFINGYTNNSIWNKQNWDRFKAKYLEREDEPYFLLEDSSIKRLSTIHGHLVLKKEIEVKVKELLKAKKILREQMRMAKISGKYSYGEVSVVDVSGRKRVLKRTVRK